MPSRSYPKQILPDATWDGENYRVEGRIWSKPFITESITPQSIGTTPTETVITFSTITDDSMLNVSAGGVFETVQSSLGFVASGELNVNNTGGASTIIIWTEVSADSGSTWLIFNNSLKDYVLPTAWSGYLPFFAASDAEIPAGTQFQIKIMKLSGGTVSLVSPTATVDAGAAAGASARVIIFT